MIKKVFNAGIYPRVSTMRQVREGFSLEAQRKNLTYFVENQGWKVCGDYGDEGISGKNVKDRPGVKRLIADIKSGKIDAVVLYKFDRLTRDSRDTEDFIELIQEYNIAVYALSGGLVDVSTPSGRFNTRILGAAAQFERETTIDRVIDGFIGKVIKGFTLCSSTCSYGYDRPKHQEVQTINEKEQDENTQQDEILGKLIINKISLNGEVKEGCSSEILEEYIGHIEETSKFDGNVGLAAHNRGNKYSYFARINELDNGDEV